MAEVKKNRVEIELPNGYKLVAEQNTDPQYSREMFVGIINADGLWCQDLAVIRSSYRYEGDNIVWNPKQFDILVYGDKDSEDFTDDFTIGLYQGDL